MKANTFFILTHAFCALLACAATAVVLLFDQYPWRGPVAIGLIAAAVAGVSRSALSRLQRGLRTVEKAAATGDETEILSAGLGEFQETAQRV